jgi:hypothetical protein
VKADDPTGAFVAEADRHPVFALTPLRSTTDDQRTMKGI